MAAQQHGPFVTGDRLPTSARWWNQLRPLTSSGLPSAGSTSAQPVQIHVRNTTGGALPRHSVVCLDGIVITPAANLADFRAHPVLDGIIPTAETLSRAAVLIEPLDDSSIGRAIVSGPVVVQVDLADGDTHAQPTVGGTDHMTGGIAGHLLLYRPASNGVQWCVVRMGETASGELIPVTLATDGGGNGTDSTPPTWTYTASHAITGSEIETGLEPETNRAIGVHIPASAGLLFRRDGDWILWTLDEILDRESWVCELGE